MLIFSSCDFFVLIKVNVIQVTVDMGEPILNAHDVPTRLSPNQGQSVVKADLEVDGLTWQVTCVSMGNPHCITFGSKQNQVLTLYIVYGITIVSSVSFYSDLKFVVF